MALHEQPHARRRKSGRWAAWLLLALCPAAMASSVLLETSTRPAPERPRVKLYSGTIPASSEAVQISPDLTVLLLVDSTSSDQARLLYERMMAVQESLKGRPFRLAMLRNGTLQVFASFEGRDKLRSALMSVSWPAPDKVEGAAIVDEIRQAVPRLGTNYAQILLAGDLPEVDPAVHEYGAALLSEAFDAQRLRVSWLPAGDSDEKWNTLIAARGGQVLGSDREQYAAALNDRGKNFVQLYWEPTPPAEGYVAFQSSVVDAQGKELLPVPDLAVSDTGKLPDAVDFEWMQQRLQQVLPQLARGEPDQALRDIMRALLSEAFAMNPLDPQSLRTAIRYGMAGGDLESAMYFGGKLVAVRPQSGEDFALYGHALVLAKRMVGAERTLKKALALGLRTEALFEDLAHTRRSQLDDRGAVEYLGEALQIDPRRQDLWFLRAGLAAQIPDVELATECLEKGLAQGGVHIPELSMLLTFYGESGAGEKQRKRLEEALAALPAQAEPRAELALALEAAHQNAAALHAWESVLALHPGDETARAHKAALLEAQGKAR